MTVSPDRRPFYRTDALDTADSKMRARLLLIDNLTDAQREEYLRHGEFLVTGADGAKYQVGPDITVRADGTRLCAISPGLPVEDQMLARKLALENAPEMFHAVANNLSAPALTALRGYPDRWDAMGVFKEIVVSVFACRGFDPDKLIVDLARRPYDHGLELRVSYGRYNDIVIVDEGHLLFGNFRDALVPIAEDLSEHMARHILKKVGEDA